MARVILDKLTKIFARDAGASSTRAVDSIDLRVEDKELLVLVGPSGCGKTTTLRLIGGLEQPTAGQVIFGDASVNDLPARERDIAMVFQHYALYPHMSVYENLAFPLKLRKIDRREIQERVQDTAEMLGLARLLARRPEALSGGERQRVALGRALVRRPQLILLDEPLSGLDPGLRAQMRSEIAVLQQRLGLTMLYVTHDQMEAALLGNRVAVMNQGKLQQIGKPRDIYLRPASRFVAEFFGSPPINFLRGTVAGTGNALFFQTQLESSASGGLCRIPLPEATAYALKSHLGKEVLCGIRPEDIKCEPQKTSEASMGAVTKRVEHLGPETHLHLACGALGLIVRTSSTNGEAINQRVALAFDMGQAHFFDATTELRLG